MDVLVACECSGVVRDALIARGHRAYSCDILPTRSPGPHLQGDVRRYLADGWDLLIAHPPCTHLAVSGSQYFSKKLVEQEGALTFVLDLLAAPIPRIALENPVGIISSRIGLPTQIVQPYWFGHPEFKATCWWLQGLPPLMPTCYIEPPNKRLFPLLHAAWSRVHRESPGPDRWYRRSLTYQGMAEAIADQWTL